MVETEWLRGLPKVELHVHLEGATPYSAFFELIRKYKRESEIPDIKALEHKFRFKDFSHFLTLWRWKNEFIREYEDFTFISSEFARQLASQNIIEVSRIADLVRDNGAETAMVILNAVNEVKSLGIVGIGIGGSEHQYPPKLFEKVFERARKLGFYTSAHAGEGDGPESVWSAIKHLRVDRIGYGARAIEEGIPVTVNTDDPMMFGNSLVDEYSALERDLGFSESDIIRLIVNAIEVAWLPQEKRLELSSNLGSYIGQ